VRAIVWTRYGPTKRLQFAEVARPAPKDGEVLVRVPFLSRRARRDSNLGGVPSRGWFSVGLGRRSTSLEWAPGDTVLGTTIQASGLVPRSLLPRATSQSHIREESLAREQDVSHHRKPCLPGGRWALQQGT